MIAITGATGNLGQLVIEELLKKIAADQIVVAVRTPAKAGALAAKGIQVREGDYSRPETLAAAFAGVTKLLLISSNDLEHRLAQHNAAIDAAKTAGVQLLAYTSILRADTTSLDLAKTHVATEQSLRKSGIPFVLLRNSWYLENHTEAIASALQQGAVIGASKDGRFAGAARADYAAAAAVVLTGSGHENQTYELAGDASYTRSDLAAEISRQTGKTIPYHDLPEVEYEKVLASFLPADLAHILADADAKAALGELDDHSHVLSRLIGRPTTTLTDGVAAALRAAH